jgi:esterase/lipase
MPQLCSNERMDAMKPKVMEERLRLDRKMKNIRNTFNRSIQMIGRKTRVILTEVKEKSHVTRTKSISVERQSKDKNLIELSSILHYLLDTYFKFDNPDARR